MKRFLEQYHPTQTTTYTLTASNSAGDATSSTTVNVGPGTGPIPGNDGTPPTGTFGVSLTQDPSSFQNDLGGNITSPSDERVVSVQPGGTFYALVSYSDPAGISSVSIRIANSSPAGLAAPLVQGQEVGGFTLVGPVGTCDLSGTQTSISCIYQINVGSDVQNIDDLQGAGNEFAYVFRVNVADTSGNLSDEAIRGYVIVGQGGGNPSPNPPNPNPPSPNPPNPNPPNPNPPAPSNYTLNVNKTGSGSGTVTSDPGGINCGSDCSESYASGTRVTLRANAANNSTFGGWGGACSGSGTCQVTMSQARNVTATFNTSSTTPLPPPPTPGATKIESFSASKTRVIFGEAVTFNWKLSGAEPAQVRLLREGSPATPIASDLVGKNSFPNYKPEITANYFLEVTTEDDNVLRSSNSIQVVVATAINGYTATPRRVGAGNPTTLSWTLSGPPATSITIKPPQGDLILVTPTASNSYSVPITSPVSGNYELTVRNAANAVATANVAVEVVAAIGQITISPISPTAGAQFTVSWTATGAEGYSVFIKEPGSSQFISVPDVNPSGDDFVRTAPSTPETYTYTLRLQRGATQVDKDFKLTVQAAQ